MKIWKAQDGHLLKDSEVVFSGTGKHRLDSGSYHKPLSLDAPMVIYFPGKGTVVPSDTEQRIPAHQREITTAYFNTVSDAEAMYDVHLRERETPPDFYVAAYTDNLSNPPAKKEHSVTALMKHHGGLIDAALKKMYGYGDYKGSRLKQVFAHMKRPASFFSHDAKMFVDDMLLPAITDGDGDLLTKEEVKQKLDNLTMVGFSYGSIFCKEVENRLQRQLTKLGAPEAEVEEMMSHVVTVSSSSVARVRGSQNLFSGYNFEGRLDVLRRHVQDFGSEKTRGVVGFPDAMRLDAIVPESVRGIRPEKRQNHSWKGLEVRDTVYRKRGLIHDALAFTRTKLDADYQPVPKNNSVMILLDAPEAYTPYYSLKDIYQEHPAHEEENKLHHQFGAALLADPNKQGHVLLFNRILNNAIERGAYRGGVDMENPKHMRELMTDVPWHDMTPPNMQSMFVDKLEHAFMLGGLEPFTNQTCDVPNARPSISGATSALKSLMSSR